MLRGRKEDEDRSGREERDVAGSCDDGHIGYISTMQTSTLRPHQQMRGWRCIRNQECREDGGR